MVFVFFSFQSNSIREDILEPPEDLKELKNEELSPWDIEETKIRVLPVIDLEVLTFNENLSMPDINIIHGSLREVHIVTDTTPNNARILELEVLLEQKTEEIDELAEQMDKYNDNIKTIADSI